MVSLNAPASRAGSKSPAAVQAEAGGPLRIALVGSCYWPVDGGMEVYLRELASALAAEGHDVRVITRFTRERPADVRAMHQGVEASREYDDGAVRVNVLAPRSGRAALLRPINRLHFHAPALAIRLAVSALGPPMRAAVAGCDVIHYSGAGRELFGFVALREASRLGVPLVVTPHTHEGVWGDSALDIDLYRRASRVVAVTQDEARRLSNAGIDPRAIRVVGHGVSVRGGGDGGRFRARHGLGNAPVVLFLGRKTADKGFDLVLESARHLWERVPDARIVVAGVQGTRKTPAPAVSDSRLLDLGHLDSQEREDAYAGCDVFCLPSEAEAFGLVIHEAWFYGKPVVVSDIPTLRERVGAGGGLVVPRRPADVASALASLLVDDELRERHGATGHAIAAASTWQRTARQMVELYADAGARAGLLRRDYNPPRTRGDGGSHA